MSVPIYIRSKVAKDDVFCIKPKEMQAAVDAGITAYKGNPSGTYESIHLHTEGRLDMRVAFYGGHPYAYVYVSADDHYQPLDSRPFDVSNGCGELHDHIARVLSAHKQ
jgi:hypothetical protein